MHNKQRWSSNVNFANEISTTFTFWLRPHMCVCSQGPSALLHLLVLLIFFRSHWEIWKSSSSTYEKSKMFYVGRENFVEYFKRCLCLAFSTYFPMMLKISEKCTQLAHRFSHSLVALLILYRLKNKREIWNLNSNFPKEKTLSRLIFFGATGKLASLRQNFPKLWNPLPKMSRTSNISKRDEKEKERERWRRRNYNNYVVIIV